MLILLHEEEVKRKKDKKVKDEAFGCTSCIECSRKLVMKGRGHCLVILSQHLPDRAEEGYENWFQITVTCSRTSSVSDTESSCSS
jgi:hypothetical protein